MKRVLSIDGGGIRGLIPAIVCEDLEERSGGQRISSLFDLIAGTSTGGILALGLCLPPKGMPASHLVQFYNEKGPKIFSNPRNKIQQKWRPKFENDELFKVVEEVFGTHTLSQATTEIVITAYDTQLRRPAYFSRFKALAKRKDDLPMGVVALATSAAPSYFPSYKIRKDFFIDGGIVANNPSCAAYAHAKRLWPDEEILLLSLGTGSISRPLPAGSQSWGELQWARPVIDCFMDGTSQATDDFFFRAHKDKYLRLQGGLTEFTSDLDRTTQESLSGLRAIAIGLIQQNDFVISSFLDRIMAAGHPIEAKITYPSAGVAPPGPIRILGEISNFRGECLYAFTGKPGRYWPSSRVYPKGGAWDADLNLGMTEKGGTITLAEVDEDLASYIEFYRLHAARISHPGMTIGFLKSILCSIDVYLA